MALKKQKGNQPIKKAGAAQKQKSDDMSAPATYPEQLTLRLISHTLLFILFAVLNLLPMAKESKFPLALALPAAGVLFAAGAAVTFVNMRKYKGAIKSNGARPTVTDTADKAPVPTDADDFAPPSETETDPKDAYIKKTGSKLNVVAMGLMLAGAIILLVRFLIR
ncbi:MAG: hypothetical protein FWE62_01125 [Firmicutes bacterium]|nr:hypothetical protein [Bacillota bacterium]